MKWNYSKGAYFSKVGGIPNERALTYTTLVSASNPVEGIEKRSPGPINPESLPTLKTLNPKSKALKAYSLYPKS